GPRAVHAVRGHVHVLAGGQLAEGDVAATAVHDLGVGVEGDGRAVHHDAVVDDVVDLAVEDLEPGGLVGGRGGRDDGWLGRGRRRGRRRDLVGPGHRVVVVVVVAARESEASQTHDEGDAHPATVENAH